MADESTQIFAKAPTFRPLRADVYESLREAILVGSLEPGARVVEAEIARQMGISRGPIREALRHLEQDGLVEYRPRRGTVVAALTRKRVLDTYAVRSVLEGLAAEQAAERITDHEVAELEALLERMLACARAGDLRGMLRIDVAFHERICAIAGNPVLLRSWRGLGPLAWRLLADSKALSGYTVTELAERHRPLIQALAGRDPERAAKVAREHTAAIAAAISKAIVPEPAGIA
jgi:DNA-binding GntR family transcriptional regulator